MLLRAMYVLVLWPARPALWLIPAVHSPGEFDRMLVEVAEALKGQNNHLVIPSVYAFSLSRLLYPDSPASIHLLTYAIMRSGNPGY